MIKYKLIDYNDGIKFLPRRFRCIPLRKNQLLENKLKYRKRLEFGAIISLFLMVVVFQGWKTMDKPDRAVKELDLVINVEEIPQTEQLRMPPAPARPSVPIETENEQIPEDETIELTDLDLSQLPPPPPPPPSDDDGSSLIFVPYDEPPMPVGGFQAILDNVKYPDIGRKAGIEGLVLLHAQIDEKGKVKEIKVIKELAVDSFAEEAKKAVRSVKWKPAMQRDRAVMAWVSIPIQFVLEYGMKTN